MALRGYGKESKAVLKDWIVDTYSTDTLKELPPLTQDTQLLKHKEAMRKADRALREFPRVILPLGFRHEKVKNFAVFKVNQFIFQTPQQYQAVERQLARFRRQNGCGIEIITLRRDYQGKRHPSLAHLAERIYEHLQTGDRDLN